MTINKIPYSVPYKPNTSIGYNPHFRPISNQQITTVEISPTGSGKTHAYKATPNTIMLMPTNLMVREHSGMVSEAIAKPGERCKWHEVDTTKCDYMTYDKFLGHSYHEDMSDLNIIIDEAHIILASLSDIHYELLDRLFNRKFDYKELKLISATLRKEILEIYDYRANEPMQVNQYIDTNFTPTIQFTRTIPDLKGKRTLFFINSMDKILETKELYENFYPGINIAIISADNPVPNLFQLASIDLLLSTCVMKQGFSLLCHIDQVVIHNVYNSIGSMDIIQYMARPRYNQPDVYVIPATTHFKVKKENMFNMPDVALLLKEVATTGMLTTPQYQTNNAIGMDEFLARAKTSQSGWNILGVTNYYEYVITFSELYYENGAHMAHSIQEIIPGVNIIIGDVKGGHRLKLSFLKLDDTVVNLLNSSKNLTVLLTNIDTVIANTTEPRVLEKMEKYKKAAKNVVVDFKMIPKGKTLAEGYRFDDACQVKQVLDNKVRAQCKQHVKNLEKHVYDYRSSHDQRSVPQLGQKIGVGKLGRKLGFLRKYFAGGGDDLNLLGKLYCFKRYDEEGTEITGRSRQNVHEVEITSMFCVETSWYYKSHLFLKVGKVVI